MSVETTYQIKGMTCGHCAQAVTGELTLLPGVRTVEVDVPAGVAKVNSDAPLALDEVRTAVDEAGYELVGIDG
ncbi:MAG: heavy-metal-associated domain-containing protein [Hamadaea sp.]|uniref:heavy-metal-associated domain-containing protein n=1 Tax=Hamadaea sp. NPDC050747 TaxID=3155789 RepID=UPI0017ECF8CF|nr:heavy-metal-associated domain-containing protein [Hamadaea sp.]NUR48568.1 heavy-metal-associated domain-containing protein [Hamadaea sp.]NUR70549.1 heavy-metal-associated domain-containing protein [Hamadaea sp.]NUT07900.1 heavy-metal-associated domain-containing protein [Hamadaea sp.]